MYNGQTVSLKTVLWKVLRNPLASELTYEEASEYAVEVIRLLGAPLSFVDKISDPLLKIVDYKSSLPSDLLNIRGVRLIPDTEDYEHQSIPLRYATDIYHESLGCNDGENDETVTEYTYTVQSGIITFSVPDGYAQVSYKALAVDEDGYPLVPNDQKILMAMEYYILNRYLEPLWMLGKITDKAYTYIEQKRYFYMASADSSLKLQGIDHLESVMNTINRLIVNTQAHNNFYKGSGLKERFRKYS